MTFIWTATLPIALVDTCGAYTIGAVPMIGLLLHSILELGNQAETPFGTGVNCLGSDMLVVAVVMDIKLLFFGQEVKLAPLDRDSAQTDAVGKMEAIFSMGLDTISLEMNLPTKANAAPTKADLADSRGLGLKIDDIVSPLPDAVANDSSVVAKKLKLNLP